jgi:hypothetical protein
MIVLDLNDEAEGVIGARLQCSCIPCHIESRICRHVVLLVTFILANQKFSLLFEISYILTRVKRLPLSNAGEVPGR